MVYNGGSEVEGGRVGVGHLQTVFEHELCEKVHWIFGKRVQ
jgi:hypothetical protein